MSAHIGPLLAGLLGVPEGTSVDALANGPPCYPATPATPAPFRGEGSKGSGVARPRILTAELEQRIREMAARWQYAPDELAEALRCAAADPAAWLSAVQWDEELLASGERVGRKHPPEKFT